MAYKDYLPDQASVMYPRYDINTTDSETAYVQRTQYRTTSKVTYGYVNTHGLSVSWDRYVELGTYASPTEPHITTGATYVKGDIVHATMAPNGAGETNLLYRYASETPLVISDSSDYVVLHPLYKNEEGNRANEDIWSNAGITNLGSMVDASAKTSFSLIDRLSEMNNTPLDTDWINTFPIVGVSTDCNPLSAVAFFGIEAVSAKVKVIEYSVVIDEFVIDMKYRTKLMLQNKGQTKITFEILFSNGYFFKEPGEPPLTEYFLSKATPSISHKCECDQNTHPAYSEKVTSAVISLGETQRGHEHHRQSTFGDVFSDDMEKSKIIKSFYVHSCVILVKKEDLLKVEYFLEKAVQGDYVFNAGIGEAFDQRVYLGKIEYSSPIEFPDYFEIRISGQSLGYGVENPLIAPDSTDGVPT